MLGLATLGLLAIALRQIGHGGGSMDAGNELNAPGAG